MFEYIHISGIQMHLGMINLKLKIVIVLENKEWT